MLDCTADPFNAWRQRMRFRIIYAIVVMLAVAAAVAVGYSLAQW